ncbi:MAG: hypothetical protein J1E82_07040 [Muribaculaceae bacterium]|nr:hypothetical protein [Muribaculaceae bacterium]
MLKNYFTTLLLAILGIAAVNAQTVYSDPSPLQLSSKDVKIYFDATGTPFAGASATTKIYAHTGYDTTTSQWNGAPSWSSNSDKYLLQYVSENLWMLYVGDIREFYNIPVSTTNVVGLEFVFRNDKGTTQTSPDIFLQVYEEGLQVSLTSNANSIITPETAYVKFTLSASQNAELSISVNGETIASASNATTLDKEYLFPNPGDYTVVGTASANGETMSESLSVTYVQDAKQADYPGGTPIMGPVKNADGSVTFCFGAPEKNQVLLVGSWNEYALTSSQAMNYQDTENGRYFWTTVNGLDNDTMYCYYFIVDGGEYIVGDPYARLVLDPYNDKYLDTGAFTGLPEYPTDALNGLNVPVAVYQGSMNDYDWQCTDFVAPDKQNLIIYELLFRDFTGTEGQAKGNGTVRLAIEKIPYLKQLGVNAIELLPIMEFNGNISWGYNPNFYFAVDKAYGTPDDYKEFIDICHENGMAVILDMVFNQSDGLHPWYQMYPPGKNPFYNLNAPHAYSVLNDWNQGMPMVQEQWADVIRYWMTEYKFDGFRFDLVKGLGLNESYANNGDAATNAYNASRVEEMAYLNSVIQSVNPNGYCINENLAGAKEENEMAADGEINWANVNDAACQFAMGYPSDSNMNRLYAVQDSRTWGSTVSYLESHDEQRLAYKQDQWGVAGVKGNAETSMQRCGSAAAQMIMTPGSHMIWQFSEMGNAQNTKNDDGGNNTDPKKVDWNLLDEPNHWGLYNNYCQLIEVRFSNPEFFTQDANFTIACNSNNWNNGRWLYSTTADGKELLTFINPNYSGSGLTINYDFKNKDNSAYKILVQSYNSHSSFDAVNGTVTVPPNCFVVIGSADLNEAGIEGITNDNLSNSLRVRGGEGEIIVDYAEKGASAYSLDGRIIGKVAETGSIKASAGLYIVKSGKNSVKVVVR